MAKAKLPKGLPEDIAQMEPGPEQARLVREWRKEQRNTKQRVTKQGASTAKREPHYDRVRQALEIAKSQGGHVRIQDSDGHSYMVPARDLERHMERSGSGTGSLSVTHLLENYDVATRQPGSASGSVEVVEPSSSGSGPTVDPANRPGTTRPGGPALNQPEPGAEGPSGPRTGVSPAVSRNAKRRTSRFNIRRASALSGSGQVPTEAPHGYVPAGSEPVAGIEDNPPPFQEMGEEEGAALYRSTQKGSASSTEEQERRVREAEASYRDELTRSQTGDPVTDEILSAGGAQARASGGDAATINEAVRESSEALGQRFRANPQAAEKFMQFGEVQTALGKEVTSAQTALRRARSGAKEAEFEAVSSGSTPAADTTKSAASGEDSDEVPQDVPDLDVADQVAKAQEAAAKTRNLPSTVDYENEADLFDVGPGELPPGVRTGMQARGDAGSLDVPKNIETSASALAGGTTVNRGPGSGVDVGNAPVHALRALVTAVQEAKRYPAGKSQPVPKPEEGEMTSSAKERLANADVKSVPYSLSHPERTRDEATVPAGRAAFQRAEGLTEVPLVSRQQQAQGDAASQDAPEHPMYGDLRRLVSGGKIHEQAEHPLHDLALSMGLNPQSGSLEHIQQAIQQRLETGGSESPTLLGRKAPVEPGALAKHVGEVEAANRRAPVDTRNRDEIFHSLVTATPDSAVRAMSGDPLAPTTGATSPEGKPVETADKPMPPARVENRGGAEAQRDVRRSRKDSLEKQQDRPPRETAFTKTTAQTEGPSFSDPSAARPEPRPSGRTQAEAEADVAARLAAGEKPAEPGAGAQFPGATTTGSGQAVTGAGAPRNRKVRGTSRIMRPGTEHARPAVPDAAEATDTFRRQAGSVRGSVEGAPRVDLTTEAAPQYAPAVTRGARNRIERRRGQRRVGTLSTGTEVHRGPAPVAPPKSKLDTEGKYRSEAEKTLDNPPERVTAIADLDESPNIDSKGLLPHESVQTTEVTEAPKPPTRVSTGGYESSGGRGVVAAKAKSPDPVLPGAAPTPRTPVLNTRFNPASPSARAAAESSEARVAHQDVLNEARGEVGLSRTTFQPATTVHQVGGTGWRMTPEEHAAALSELAAGAAASQKAR